MLFELNASFGHVVVSLGRQPENRSKAKGMEPEGLGAETFGNDKLFFVLAEQALVFGLSKEIQVRRLRFYKFFHQAPLLKVRNYFWP